MNKSPFILPYVGPSKLSVDLRIIAQHIMFLSEALNVDFKDKDMILAIANTDLSGLTKISKDEKTILEALSNGKTILKSMVESLDKGKLDFLMANFNTQTTSVMRWFIKETIIDEESVDK